MIYTFDHQPAHVHVAGAGNAKINLFGPDDAPELMSSAGISRSDLRRLMAVVVEQQTRLLAEWERIHGPSD